MNHFNVAGALQAAVQYHQNGQLAQAQALYRQILQANPNHPDALHLLGLIEHQQGRSAHGLELIQRAVQARPNDPTFHFNLGNMHQDLGQLDAAIACFGQALRLQPGFAEAHLALGTAFKAKNRLIEAIASYRKALSIAPDFAQAHENLGNAFKETGQFDQAIASYRQALLLRPDQADLHSKLGLALHSAGRLEEAIASYRRALQLNPAIDGLHSILGDLLLGLGHLDEAIASYRQALASAPDAPDVFSNLLFALQCASHCTPAALFAEHQRYAERFEAPLKPHWQPHGNRREPGRRLKVGYVSGDFYNGSVAYFLEPILACHDKTRFEIFAYYNHDVHDSHTDLMMRSTDHWCVCNALSDDQLEARIRLDAIDILVDLSGHTGRNRLPVFARKPAPVQASYIGYPGSTGLTAFDYRISDPWQDPPGLTERYHSEALVRIPGGMAFAPEPNAPEVNALPALSSGELVLACLNNLSKVNPAVINLWARILQALPQARLMLGNVMNKGIRQRLLDLFSQAGIGPERLILQPRVGMAEYLALHHQIDIALDPFPYNGGTTTMHSLWMGVPVIALAGEQPVARLCAAHLSRVGLSEFVCQSEDDYLHCAIKFANDLPALDAVRQSLRARMNAPECQSAAITRQLEAAYRSMWRTWCNA